MNEEIQHPILGVDHGEARIGLAITDVVGILAHPLETIQVKTTDPVTRIVELIIERGVQQVVIGLPLRMDGSEGTAAEKIRKFTDFLAEKITIPIKYQDERLTTVSAAAKLHQAGRNAKKQKTMIDQAAAVEILSDWLSAQTPEYYQEDFHPDL